MSHIAFLGMSRITVMDLSTTVMCDMSHNQQASHKTIFLDYVILKPYLDHLEFLSRSYSLECSQVKTRFLKVDNWKQLGI
jgi:hypothetical protein